MNSQISITVKGGIIATVIMTLVGIIAPIAELPRMLVGNMLAGFMHIPLTLGWIMHFIIGTILAAGYVFLFRSILPGSALVKGITYGIVPFLLAQIMVLPMMGAGFFSSNTPAPLLAITTNLIAHIAYGGVLGFITREHTVTHTYQNA